MGAGVYFNVPKLLDTCPEVPQAKYAVVETATLCHELVSISLDMYTLFHELETATLCHELVSISLYMYTLFHELVSICTYLYVCLHICTYMYIFYVCLHMCTCMHTYVY